MYKPGNEALCNGKEQLFVDFTLYMELNHFSLCHIHRLFVSTIPLGGTMIGGQVAR